MESTPAGHSFTSGQVLGATFSIFFSNLPAFGLIVALILLPVLVGQGLLTLAADVGPNDFSPWSLVLILLQFILGPLATAALTYGVFQQVRGKSVSVADCLTVGLRRVLPVLGVGILVGLITGIGVLLCIVPGIVAATILAAAVPAAVIERPGVLGALSRSSSLTENYRWTAFGVIFGIGILQFLTNLVVGMLSLSSPVAYFVGIVLVLVVFTGLQATASTLLYYNLRQAKETIDVEEIAAVFA